MTDKPEHVWITPLNMVTEYRCAIDTDGHDPRISGCVQYTRTDVSEAAIAKARNDALEEVARSISKMSVTIEGTPYECGPREWVAAIQVMKTNVGET